MWVGAGAGAGAGLSGDRPGSGGQGRGWERTGQKDFSMIFVFIPIMQA